MRIFCLALVLVGSNALAGVFSSSGYRDVMANDKKGSFSLVGAGIYSSARLVNTDGTYAAYTGQGLGAMVMIDLIGNEYVGGLGIFGQYSLTEYKGQGLETLSRNQVFGGVLAHLGAGFYLGFGYGTDNFIQRNYSRSASFSGRVLGAGLGVSFLQILPSIDFVLQGWYKTGYLPKSMDLSSNTGSDQVEGFLGIRWSPNTSNDSYL